MRLLIGVDAGGTQTLAAAQRDDREAVVVLEGAANPSACGIEAAAETIVRAIERACEGDAPAAIAVGAAGAGRQSVCDAISRAIAQRFGSARIEVGDDAPIALRAAVPHGDGIVLIAGTGSVAYAEIGERRLRAGGGGYAFGDEGSGYAIGAAAARSVLHAYDGRAPRDAFVEALEREFECRDGASLRDAVYGGAITARVARVAPAVLERAAQGDRHAVRIVQTAAKDLFEMVRAVDRAAACGSSELPLAFQGGLLTRNSLLTFLIETRIAADLPHLRIVKGGAPPYRGALARAAAL